MDDQTSSGNPTQCEPIDQKGRNRTTRSKGIQGPYNQEYDGYCCYREQDEFLENFHVSAFAILRQRKPITGRFVVH